MKSILTLKWLRRAQRLNPYYKTKLNWSLPTDWPDDAGSAAFAQRVATFQGEHKQLSVDGVLGPKTYETLQGKTWKPPVGEYLIVAGEQLPVSFPVVTYNEPNGLSFYGNKGWRKRRDPSGKGVNLFVLHWDGCVSSHQCFNVLLSRGLSVHLMLDGDGTVYQALDLAEARAYHAGKANERSIGIEITNPVRLHRNKWQKPPRPVITESRVHRRGKWERLDFYDIQKRRIVELSEVLCEHLRIPRLLPTRGDEVLKSMAPPGFKGVCGHYHLSNTKTDPGLSLWPGLKEAFSKSKQEKE